MAPALLPRTRLDGPGLGSSPFDRHYLGNHCCFLLLPLLRCFSSRGWLAFRRDGASHRRVAPFGNPGITGYLLLPRDYRSLSRPSSPPRAQASTVRPYLLPSNHSSFSSDRVKSRGLVSHNLLLYLLILLWYCSFFSFVFSLFFQHVKELQG